MVRVRTRRSAVHKPELARPTPEIQHRLQLAAHSLLQARDLPQDPQRAQAQRNQQTLPWELAPMEPRTLLSSF